MYLLIVLYIIIFGKKIAIDEFGNKYYQLKTSKFGRPRRFVLYKGKKEASKVSAHWHAWLRNTIDSPIDTTLYGWQKIHTPNLTGTKNSYSSKGETKSYNDYTAWKND